MQHVTATEAKNNLGAIIDMALKEPVAISRNGRDSVVMIPAEDFAEYERKKNAQKLIETMDKIGKAARKRGLTDKIAREILADIS